MVNEYIPSNLHLKKNNGVISITRCKKPTSLNVKSKLASRKVIFEDPLCLNDNDAISDGVMINNEVHHYNNGINDAVSDKIGLDLGYINDNNDLVDLKEKVQDLSTQLEEISKYARSSLNENDECFCHDLVGGKCLLPQNHLYTESSRLKTPPELWLSKPDCCQSCTVPCHVKADITNSTNSTNNLQTLHSHTDEERLQHNLSDIRHRLSLLQDNYAPKLLPTSSSTFERDIDEHLEEVNKQNISHKRSYNYPSSNQISSCQNKVKSMSNQKKSTNEQTLKPNKRSTTAEKRLQSYQQKPQCVPKQKLINSPYHKVKPTSNTTKCQNIVELSSVKNGNSPKTINDNDDPEITLNKLEKYLETSEIITDPKDEQKSETKICQQQTELDEAKEMVNELRSIYHEVKDLLLNVRNQINENKDLRSEQTEKVDTNIDPNVLLSNSQPVLTPGSLLPSIRLVMDYSGKTMTPTTDITQAISNLPDDPIVKASTALNELNRRRNNLENNLATLECSHNDQSIFGLLDLLSKDRSSAEKARIQAMINDAIDNVVHEKKLEHSKSSGRISRLSQPKSHLTSRLKVGKDTSSICSSPTRSRNVVELFDQPKLYSSDRSPSPVTLTAPWRLNRRRAKGPLYPRSINDPVRPRTAILRLSDENLSGISSSQGRMPRSSSKVVRFIDHQDNELSEPTELKQIHSNKHVNLQSKLLTKPTSGIIPLGMYQYSLSIPPNKISTKVDKAVGFTFKSNQLSKQPPNDANNLSQTELEDNILSRLVLQISEQLTKNTRHDQGIDTSSNENLQHLVEAALLERLGSILSPSSVSPSPTSQQQQQQQRLKTPCSSPERSNNLDLLHIPTPIDSINRSESPYSNDHFSRKSKTPEPVSKWQPYNPDEESIFKNPRLSPTNRRDISTPEPSFSLRSKLRSQSSSPVKQKSVMISPFPSSPQRYTSEKNVSEKPAEINSRSLHSSSTALINTRSSSFTEPFSLTAPDTFSDGMWLLDRSEGEAPYPVPYNRLKLIMSKMEPIQSSTRRNNSLTQTFSISKSTSSSSSSSSSITKHSKRDQISPGQFPNPLTTANRPGHNQINPLNNPLLHVLALKNSNHTNKYQLSHHDRNEVKKILTRLKQSRQYSNGIVHSPSLEWLASLSGSPLPQLSSSQTNVKSYQSKDDSTKSQADIVKKNGSSTLIDSETRQSVKQDYSNKTDHSISEGESAKMSMLRQVELVHSGDSDATTIDDEAYDDDFTGEQSN
ncbi:hypothetical protein MN116_002305 [Schistosoma mekongi]|uniref:Uncharacterized protein n=1 Tax=Schistosoma mekongi TaxID=38744 RepID=A0AAE1ZKV4_SCHME|nr:hypothetical protein MN116_002305 [Schistosoma mekongi]